MTGEHLDVFIRDPLAARAGGDYRNCFGHNLRPEEGRNDASIRILVNRVHPSVSAAITRVLHSTKGHINLCAVSGSVDTDHASLQRADDSLRSGDIA